MGKRSEDALPDEMTQPARAGAIIPLVEFVSRHAWEAGFAVERIQEIGRAVEEALRNIVRFACPDETEEIRISCEVHESGTFLITIVDTGRPFNMLLADTFPETADFYEPGKLPSTQTIKKVVKNIEYRRGTDRNTLVFTIFPDMTKKS